MFATVKHPSTQLHVKTSSLHHAACSGGADKGKQHQRTYLLVLILLNLDTTLDSYHDVCYVRGSSGTEHLSAITGGVSMGETDFIKPLLERHGKVHFGKVKMKPGKPLTFATIDVEATG